MKKEVRLKFDDKDIMFDAFVEMIVDNNNCTWSENGECVVCFINDAPCSININHGNYECYFNFTGKYYSPCLMCNYIEETLNNNEDGYIYHCNIDRRNFYRIMVTATTIIDE